MEIQRSLLCPECCSEIKIFNGDFLFTYNIECSKGHKKANVDLDILLKNRKAKQNLFKCQSHRKKRQIHCFTCNEDICNLCFNDLHKTHEIEYFKNLTLDSRAKYDSEFNLNKLKQIFHIFVTELNNFQSKLNLYINIFKSQLKKQLEFRTELVTNITANSTSYIDIENYKMHSVSETYNELNKKINKFISKVTFLEKFDCLKDICEELIKKNKYIEGKKINNRINDYINLNLTPINNNDLFIQLKKNYIANISELTIFKENKENNSDKYIYEPLISKSFPFIINKGPILIDNKNNKENSFYCLANNSVLKVTVLNDKSTQNNIENSEENNCIINIINVDKVKALVYLTTDKNIIFNTEGKIFLYNDLFKNEKLIGKTNRTFNIVDNSLKINENTFVYTLKNDTKINTVIYTMYVTDEDNIDIYEIQTNDLTPFPIIYIKEKKILLSLCYKYKYNNIKENNYYCIGLIDFSLDTPIMFQMVNINYYEISKKMLYFNCFNDDSYYFPITQQTYKNEMFFNVIYIAQYKFINGELMEVSRIKKEDDLSIKRYNSYGN